MGNARVEIGCISLSEDEGSISVDEFDLSLQNEDHLFPFMFEEFFYMASGWILNDEGFHDLLFFLMGQ